MNDFSKAFKTRKHRLKMWRLVHERLTLFINGLLEKLGPVWNFELEF